jgi:hypothetical protein
LAAGASLVGRRLEGTRAAWCPSFGVRGRWGLRLAGPRRREARRVGATRERRRPGNASPELKCGFQGAGTDCRQGPPRGGVKIYKPRHNDNNGRGCEVMQREAEACERIEAWVARRTGGGRGRGRCGRWRGWWRVGHGV